MEKTGLRNFLIQVCVGVFAFSQFPILEQMDGIIIDLVALVMAVAGSGIGALLAGKGGRSKTKEMTVMIAGWAFIIAIVIGFGSGSPVKFVGAAGVLLAALNLLVAEAWRRLWWSR